MAQVCLSELITNRKNFARKNFVSPMSRIQFYSLRKRKKWRNSIESLKCSHWYFAKTISPSWNQALTHTGKGDRDEDKDGK